MKRVLLFITIIMVLLLLCSCGSGGKPKNNNVNIDEIEDHNMLDSTIDSAKQTEQMVSWHNLLIANVGESVFFGTYEQDNNTDNGQEGIEWVVLAKEDDKLLVISKYALDCQPYNTEWTDVTWENCTLREWLNDEFFQMAFSEDEQAMIPTVTIANEDTQYYYKETDLFLYYSFQEENGYERRITDGGADTQDKVFLLSAFEAENYLDLTTNNEEERISVNPSGFCNPTIYAMNHGVYVLEQDEVENYPELNICVGNCWWYLRSPAYDQHFVASVGVEGSVNYNGGGFAYEYAGVRPALWIDLSANTGNS